MTPALLLAALAVGYLAGRRSYRRKLQTSDGRSRAGVRVSDGVVSLDELLTPHAGEMPTVLMPALAPRTRPIPVQR